MAGMVRLVAVLAIAAMLHSADSAPLMEHTSDAVLLDDAEFGQDLGESADIEADQSALNEVGAMASYTATKKKYEGLIKKVKAGLKKKKAKAKKTFDAQMAQSAKTFAKLYAPIKGAKKNEMGAPLGSSGQAGISSMVRWGYATQVANWVKLAHKKMARYELMLQENRYRHFSTGVCKEVLKSKVDAIGDLQYKKKKSDVMKALKKQKVMLNKKVAFDRADMQHKEASFAVWNKSSQWAANGGLMGQNKKKPHMMTAGENKKMGDSRLGELTQAAHWAFARQKTHAISFYERNVSILKKRLKKITKQHDLTLCRTGRKPNSPQLKFELKRAKKALKKQIKKMPAKAQKKAAKKALKKKLKKKKKKLKKAKKAKKKSGKEEDTDENDLGDSDSIDEDTGNHDATTASIIAFHKLIDSSGGDEDLAERASMFKNLVESEQLEKRGLAKSSLVN